MALIGEGSQVLLARKQLLTGPITSSIIHILLSITQAGRVQMENCNRKQKIAKASAEFCTGKIFMGVHD